MKDLLAPAEKSDSDASQYPDAIAGFKKLNQIIGNEFSGNDFLCHFVQRALCHRAHPYHRIVEEELVTRFADGHYSLA